MRGGRVDYGVVFSEPGRVELEELEPERVGEGSIAVRTLYSLISTGTELTVLNRRFEAGSHWDRWVKYPFRPGYAAVGEVVEVGVGVEGLARGDLVASPERHASSLVAPAYLCTPLPTGIDPAVAAWFALAKIAFMGAQAAAHHLGDTVAVIGAGPIGQMAVRWANAAGVRAVVAIDSVPSRLEFARRGGATAVITKPAAEAADEVRSVVGPAGPDVVIDTTGNAEVLSAALGLVRSHGRVVVLGDTGAPTDQHLTSDLIIRGITVVGAHDIHSRSDVGWDGDRAIHSLFFHLVATDRFNLQGLNTHVFDPRDCAEAYRLANDRRGETVGIIFDWGQL